MNLSEKFLPLKLKCENIQSTRDHNQPEEERDQIANPSHPSLTG